MKPGSALGRDVRRLLLALQFLTRVPVTGRLARWVGWQAEELNASARYFPLVGALVGAVGAMVLVSTASLWPMPVAVGLSVAATLLLTGAFHEDGLADTFDGLGGSAERGRALEIMKDSRLGTYGTLALVLVLGLKLLALASLPIGLAAAGLCAAHALSRAVAVLLIRALPYVGDAAQARARPLAQRVSGASALVACLWPLLLVVALCGAAAWGGVASFALPPVPAWGLAVLAAAVAGTVCARWFRRRLGGVTGDTLGAAQQLSEAAVYLALLAMLGR